MPYASGLITKSPYGLKRNIQSSIVAILHLKKEGRILSLIQPRSRALRKNEIHELMVTDEKEPNPDKLLVKFLILVLLKYIGEE